MKTKYIFIFVFITSICVSNAQSIESVKISFIQTLFPKQTLPGSVKNYHCTITTPYLTDDSSFRKIAEEKLQKDIENYPNTVKAAQKHYDDVILKDYEKSVEDAKEKYKLENEEFNKMSKLERLALIDKKPVLKIPEKPDFVTPPQPKMENINTSEVIIFNPETLAKNYIKLEGYGNASNEMEINIKFQGFDYIEPTASVVDIENYNPQTKEKFITKQNQFTTKFRHPTHLEIKINGAELFSGIFGQTNVYQNLTTNNKPTRLPIEKQEVEKIVKEINSYLNNEYGYPKIHRNAIIYSVKNKKGEYDDIEQAKKFAVSGFKNYTTDQEEAVKDIYHAVEIWEKAIIETDYVDSKARIDEKVGTALLKNLIYSTIIINEFDKAEKYLNDFKQLRLNYDDKQFLSTHEQLFSELKNRFENR